jgi:hypothetical protein
VPIGVIPVVVDVIPLLCPIVLEVVDVGDVILTPVVELIAEVVV